jgi:PAS domain S-box-containing protein
MVNDAAVQLLRYDEEELVGFPLKALFFEAETAVFYRGSPMWRELVERGHVRDRELVCRSKDGSRMPVSFSGSVMRDAKGDAVGVICVAEDLRESKRLLAEAAAAAEAERAKSAELEAAYRELQNLQTHLVQTEKMTSLGRMAAGIAHEINNPLGGIVIYSHLLLEDMPPDDPKRGEIVKGLLGFARPQVAAGQLLNPGRVLMDSLSVLNGQALFHNIEVRTDIEPNLPHVPGDAGQIQQAFMNMIFNAADAMEGKGRLVLKAHADTKNEAVKVSISDTGPGIEPENISRLFEPFFTTKPPGRGLGLGLAITYGIIKQHGGTIDVETEVGKGTTFEVRLPCNVTVP